MIRKVLSALYLASGVLGAASIVLLAVLVLAQIVGRLLHFQVRGADDFTAWLMAAGAFLSMAYTFQRGAHVRVGFLIESLAGSPRRGLEIACLATAATMAIVFTLAAFDLVHDSWRFDDIASGLVRIPMWIPQASMFLGALILTIAVLDDLAMVLLGHRTSYEGLEEATALEQASEEVK